MCALNENSRRPYKSRQHEAVTTRRHGQVSDVVAGWLKHCAAHYRKTRRLAVPPSPKGPTGNKTVSPELLQAFMPFQSQSLEHDVMQRCFEEFSFAAPKNMNFKSIYVLSKEKHQEYILPPNTIKGEKHEDWTYPLHIIMKSTNRKIGVVFILPDFGGVLRKKKETGFSSHSVY